MNWVVMKFGGTSVADSRCWQRIVEHVRQVIEQDQHALLVVSAVAGVTDAISGCLSGQLSSAEALNKLDQCHADLCAAFELDSTGLLAKQRQTLKSLLDHAEPTPARDAQALAMGELMSSTLGHAILGKLGLDVSWQAATELLQAADDAQESPRRRYLSATCRPQADAALAGRLAAQSRVHITQGFVASRDGETVVLGRGGSDTSAAYLAVRLAAIRCEIWTDVPGMFSANPRYLPAARLLKNLGYREAQELASMGARVLHPRCLGPVREAKIPLAVRQTSRPEIEGTVISEQARDFGAQVKAIVQRKGITLISMEGLRMWHQVGFLARAFAVFQKHHLSIDLISTSEASVTVSLDMAEHLLDEQALNEAVTELESICRVRVLHHCASVSLIGSGIRTILHRLGAALEVFEQRKIHLVSQAANDLNLTFVVDQRDADKLVQQLHQQLIPGGVGGDSVFGPTWRQLDQGDAVGEARPLWWRERADELLGVLGDGDSAYIYSLAQVQAAAARLTSLHAVDQVLYAMKANSHPRVIAQVAAAGCGLECVSMNEVRRVIETVPEMDRQKILFTPNFAPLAEYQAAFEAGIRVTVDNIFVLEHWGEHLAGQSVFLRLDPGSGLGHHKMVRTAGQNAKFGIPLDEMERVQALAARYSIKVVGLHAHTGSGVMHPDAWQRTVHVLSAFVEQFPDVEIIDAGGGLGVPDKQEDLPFDLGALSAALTMVREQMPRPVKVWIEPGRYLVAESGVLLARVTQTKGKGEMRYVGVATGMNSLIRPALYGAYHEIYNLSRLDQRADTVYNVVGPICETADILGLDRVLPQCQEGDVLLIANAGAYGATMASNYNMRAPAPEMVID